MIGAIGYTGNNSSYIIQAAKINPASLSTADEQALKHSSSPEVRNLKRTGAIECETCKNRKYQDGSNRSTWQMHLRRKALQTAADVPQES